MGAAGAGRADAGAAGARDHAGLGPVRRGTARLRAVRRRAGCDRNRRIGILHASGGGCHRRAADRAGPGDARHGRASHGPQCRLARVPRAAHPSHAVHARAGGERGHHLFPAADRAGTGLRHPPPGRRKGARLMRWRERADAWLVAALLIVAAICIAVLSTRFGFVTDWSAGARASISQQSQAILKQLSGPIDAVSYARPGGNLRDEIATVIARYQRFKPDLKLSFVDPDADPAAMRKAGISVDGEIVLHWRDREQHVVQLDERDFTDALARLTRGRDRLVAFVTGDGERNADGKANADLGDFVAQMSGGGVRAMPLNLAQNASVPRNTDLLVLASPQAELSPASLKAISDYLDRE